MDNFLNPENFNVVMLTIVVRSLFTFIVWCFFGFLEFFENKNLPILKSSISVFKFGSWPYVDVFTRFSSLELRKFEKVVIFENVSYL